ncbi:MAG TPA: aa3-type cytochrome c oxidase subunit IV, partial [Afifellaceae bacterium]|nr:aa3-type cytochrome c oxidase subunit IV [Afifellaceae bacterium]
TYEGFVALTTIGILHTITIVLALVMFGFGGSGSFWLGLVTLFLAAAAAAVGIMRGGTWKPAAWVLGLAAILAIFAVS